MEKEKQTAKKASIVNGVNVTELFKTVEAVKVNPMIARFQFRLKNEWVDGAHSRSMSNDFHGVGQDLQRPQTFVLNADEPPILLGNDRAPNAGEYLLSALAACVTSAIVYHAAARGVVIEEIESRVEGDIDLRGFLGIDKTVRNGFQNIRMTFHIHADASDKQLEELALLGPTFSPVFDSLTKGVPVTVQAKRMSTDRVSDAA